MGDFGIKVSQAGKDVKDSGDSEMLFSSGWPVPKILFQGRIQSSISVSPSVVIAHGLGYVPFFLPYTTKNNQNFSIFREIISADRNNIYYSAPGGGGSSGPIDFGLYIFDVDIEKNFLAPNINVGISSNTGADKDYGIKLSKEGKDISSHDLRDFILHSSTRTPLLHAVVNSPPNAPGSAGIYGSFEYTHNLPYDPLFLAYVRNLAVPGAYTLTNNFSGLVTSGKKITFQDMPIALDPRASLVILKDPFQVDNELILKL